MCFRYVDLCFYVLTVLVLCQCKITVSLSVCQSFGLIVYLFSVSLSDCVSLVCLSVCTCVDAWFSFSFLSVKKRKNLRRKKVRSRICFRAGVCVCLCVCVCFHKKNALIQIHSFVSSEWDMLRKISDYLWLWFTFVCSVCVFIYLTLNMIKKFTAMTNHVVTITILQNV